MADFRRPSVRLIVGLAVFVLTLLQIQGLLHVVNWQARQRRRLAKPIESALRVGLPAFHHRLEQGERLETALEPLWRSTGVAEMEALDGSGRVLAAVPRAAPGAFWPPESARRPLGLGRMTMVGPVGNGLGARLFIYVPSQGGGQGTLLRVAVPAAELAEDLRECRMLLVIQGITLLALVLVGGLTLFPASSGFAPEERSANRPYEEALVRLREHGRALSDRHEAERARLEEQIRDKDAMARAGELTAGMVHEVRNGLGTILGYARIVEQSAGSSSSVEAAVRIREECEALEAVARRFMEFVKNEDLHVTRFPVGPLLARVAAREQRHRPIGGVTLDGDPELAIMGDEELLERAFENLVRNAYEAAGSEGEVNVRWEAQTGSVLITILDSGPGLAAEARQRLAPFFTTKPGGLGLGLAIAFKLIRLHSGDLRLENVRPRGLAVLVVLPSAGAESVTHRNANAARDDGAGPGSGAQMTDS